MKTVIKYQNRYRDIITFTLLNKKEVLMECGEHLRYGFSDEDVIIMVDPSGGPYLESGHDLNEFGFGSKTPMIIDQFKVTEDKIIILLK